MDLKNLSILIVDDVKSMRSIVQKMLRNLGIGKTLHMAENGLEGLRVLHSTRVDLVIIDWKMPIMNGSQLLEAIRDDKHLRDIPVLMVSGESEKDIVLEAAEIEVEGYLIKPLTPAVLDDKIRSIIHQTLHPDMATLHIRKARTFEEAGDFTSAIEHIKYAALLKPTASRILRNLGLLYQKTGNEETMEKCLQKAASVNQQDVVTRHLLGEIYWEKNDLISAAQYYLEVISMTQKFTDRAVLLGEALLDKNFVLLAKNIFSTIISKFSKNLTIIEKILDICIRQNELEYSKTILSGLIKDFPSNYDLIYKTGVICETMGEVDAALEYFLTVDKHQGTRQDVKLKIAKLFYDKNKIIQADNYLNMVLHKNPNHKEALALRRLF
ncbi:MAG: response regulator [Desulfobacula sp.]|uniref:response regulator n=1 Tax=Desulfobacula sp. TaxID=2593537 RepID=UPI0025BE4B78|nr:response regulator [Desulfobacula sp.]MCD4720539.1 response regulator [Desulfobacula sp.]